MLSLNIGIHDDIPVLLTSCHRSLVTSEKRELSCALHFAAEPSFAGEAAMKSSNNSSKAVELLILLRAFARQQYKKRRI